MAISVVQRAFAALFLVCVMALGWVDAKAAFCAGSPSYHQNSFEAIGAVQARGCTDVYSNVGGPPLYTFCGAVNFQQRYCYFGGCQVSAMVCICPPGQVTVQGGCGCPVGQQLVGGVCVTQCPPVGTAPTTDSVWDAQECRWEYSGCNVEHAYNSQPGLWSAGAHQCSGACVWEAKYATAGETGWVTEWGMTGMSCAVADEGHTDPPQDCASTGQVENPVTGACQASCAAGEENNPVSGACQAQCTPGQAQNEVTGACEAAACPVGTIYDSAADGCVYPDAVQCGAGRHYVDGVGCVDDTSDCPTGTHRTANGNCLRDTLPPTTSTTQTSQTGGGAGTAGGTTTTQTTSPDGTVTSTTTSTVQNADGSLTTTSVTVVTPAPGGGVGGNGGSGIVAPVAFEGGPGIEAPTWTEINLAFFARMQALDAVEAATGAAAAFPVGEGACPFGDIVLPWGTVSMSWVCGLWADVSGVIRATALAVWSLAGLLIVLTA